MKLFENWLIEDYNMELDTFYLNGYSQEYIEKVYYEYNSYKQNLPLTKSFEESLSYLQNHNLFRGEFEKCFQILGEKSDSPIMYEVDMFHYDKDTQRWLKYHACDFDGVVDNYEKAIITLAHLVEGNFL